MPPEQYISLFFSLFHTGIPWAVIGITVLIAIFASACLYYKSCKHVLVPWIIAILFLMVYTAVLRRTSQSEYSIHLLPFWSIQAIRDGYIETFYEKIYNVIFFIPYGFLLGAYPHPLPKGKGEQFCRVILIGFLTSVTIELLQLITRTGTCETDDVICNTVGCGIGAVFGVAICWSIRKLRNK